MKKSSNKADQVEQKQARNELPPSAVRSKRPFNWRFVITGFFSVVAAGLIGMWIAFCPALNAIPLWDFCLFQTESAKYPHFFDLDATACGIKPVERTFQSGGSKLDALYYRWPRSKYIILFSHAKGGNLMTEIPKYAFLMSNMKCSLFGYDYRGYGKSEGRPSQLGICEDARAAYDYVTGKLGYSPDHVIIFGESLGTAVSCQLASHVKAAGVILLNPMNSLRQRGVEILPPLMIYPWFMWPVGGLDNGAALSHVGTPKVIIGGTKDNMLPINHADALFKAAADPKFYARVEGGGHLDPVTMNSPLLVDGLLWLKKQINKTADAGSKL